MTFVTTKYRNTPLYSLVYAHLGLAAQAKTMLTYKSIAVLMGLPARGNHMSKETGHMLGEISEDEIAKGLPMLSALVATMDTKMPGSGFFDLAQALGKLQDISKEGKKRFWEQERAAVYRIWEAAPLEQQKVEEERLAMTIEAWLDQALLHKMSADAIQSEIKKILPFPQGTQQLRLAYTQSFLLLTGFAFESLFKAIRAARHQAIIQGFPKGGHGIAEEAKKQVPNLLRTAEEINLLDRLEAFLIWAGRYPHPLKEPDLRKAQDQRSNLPYKSDDPDLIDSLFTRLRHILETERAKLRIQNPL